MHIRKMFTAVEEIFSEAGREASPPLRKVAVKIFRMCIGSLTLFSMSRLHSLILARG